MKVYWKIHGTARPGTPPHPLKELIPKTNSKHDRLVYKNLYMSDGKKLVSAGRTKSKTV